MDGQGVFTGFDEQEFELLRWATSRDEADEVVYAEALATMTALDVLKKKRMVLLTRLASGGRKRKHVQRPHEEYHKKLVEDIFGVPAFTVDGVVHESQ